MFLRFLPTGACLIFWYHTEQHVCSLTLWGHSFHHFSFNEYLWTFVRCQAFFKEQAGVVNKTGGTPVVATYPVEILHVPEHGHLCSLNLVCLRLNITWFHVVSSVVFEHSGLRLLFSRGNRGSLHLWTPTFCILPTLQRPSCLWCGRGPSSAAQGGLGIVSRCMILLAPVKTVVN